MMFTWPLQSGSGRSPQPTNARRARGEELQGERTFVAGASLLLDRSQRNVTPLGVVGVSTEWRARSGPVSANRRVLPAARAHHSTSDILGFKAPPEMAIQIQVTKIPNR
jgi:hypothetical protein